MSHPKPKVQLENWHVVVGVLLGDAFNHPRFADGTFIRTSGIVKSPDCPRKGDTIETRNTLYTLGEPWSDL